MPFSNPFSSAPRLPSPRKRSMHSRSASQSPVRPPARDADPLLRDLSPTATFRAFTADPQDALTASAHALREVTQYSSHAERALGARAAKACLDLRSWVQEMESWEWSGSFDVPSGVRKRNNRKSAIGFGHHLLGASAISASGMYDDEQYWGSLPAQLVQEYEARADEIGQQLDEMNMKELKEYILISHDRAGSRPPSRIGELAELGTVTDLKKLDDYTAVVTATILQALPYLSRLDRLLDIWTVRLIILRSASTYLHDLKRARAHLDQGWAAVMQPPASGDASSAPAFTREIMIGVKTSIERQVHSLGKRLDRFLDDLEGRDDTVPETWIDDFELLESAYGSWVVQAERKLQEAEWQEMKIQKALATIEESDAIPQEQRLEIPAVVEDEFALRDAGVAEDQDFTEGGNITDNIRPPSLEQLGEEEPVIDDSVQQGPELFVVPDQGPTWPLGGPLNSNPPDPTERDDISTTLDITESALAHQVAASEPSASSHPHILSERPARHDTPLSAAGPKVEAPERNVKKRAAFLNGIERTNSLQQQSKSPVRPFEHASNAFTRLFKKINAADAPNPARVRPLISRSISDNQDQASNSPLSPVADAASKFDALHRGGINASLSVERPNNATAFPIAKRSMSVPLQSVQDSLLTADSSSTSVEPIEDQDSAVEEVVTSTATDMIARPIETEEVLSPPFESPHKTHRSADWPLPAATNEVPDDIAGTSLEHGVAISQSTQSQFPDSDMHISRVAMPTDTFDKIFIEDMPEPVTRGRESVDYDIGEYTFRRMHDAATRGQDLDSKVSPVKATDVEPVASMSPAKPSPNTQTHSSTSDRASQYLDGVSVGSPRRRPPQTEDRAGSHASIGNRPVSMVAEESNAEEAQEDFMDSTPSSPVEIRNALSVGYIQVRPSFDSQHLQPIPHSSSSSSSSSRRPSQTNSDGSTPLRVSRLDIPETLSKFDSAISRDESHALIKRASVASMEPFTRADIKSVDVLKVLRRANTANNTPITSPLETPFKFIARSNSVDQGIQDYFTPADKDIRATPSSPTPPPRASTQRQRESSISSILSPSNIVEDHASSEMGEGSPIVDQFSAAPLNIMMNKRQTKRTERKTDHFTGVITPSTSPAKVPKAPSSVVEDSFDRHVSEVLQKLPSSIKFKARPGAETPVSRPASEMRMYPAIRAKNARGSARSASMTIAPAESSPKKPSSATDPVVKLYHLTQAGREEPIKLYVRLVGENERVMVRVGGGWADLADYLRQYAEHHGSRTVSEGNSLEVQTITGVSQRKLSGSAARSPLTPVSHSARPSSKDGAGKGDAPHWPDEARFDEEDTVKLLTPQTFTFHSSTPTRALLSTPKSGSRPSTADQTTAGRPQSRQSYVENGGLAGPGSGKKAELSEHKAKWVEGMLERAKKASAEKSKDENQKYFSELGKAGATRRVIFRSPSAASTQPPSEKTK